jgi:hypothetical protein
MKVRIYYDGYKDQYQCQYRQFGIWRIFRDDWDGTKQIYVTQSGAVDNLTRIKVERQADRKKEAAAKERSKKSGVVYEDVI